MERSFGHPLGEGRLAALAARIGSDVPFLLRGGRAVGRRRGERLSFIESGPGLPMVLALTTFSLSTADVYREFDRLGRGGGRHTDAVGPEGERRLELLIRALSAGRVGDAAAHIRNDLGSAAVALRPEIQTLSGLLARCGCPATLVSGSGPTVFGLASGEGEARRIAAEAARRLPAGLQGKVRFLPLESAPQTRLDA